jgi:hypothetical protein
VEEKMQPQHEQEGKNPTENGTHETEVSGNLGRNDNLKRKDVDKEEGEHKEELGICRRFGEWYTNLNTV